VTFRSRLLLAQAPLAAALLLVGVASLRTVSALGKNAENSLRDNYRSAVATQRMSAALEHVNRDALLLAVGKKAADSRSPQMERFDVELRAQWENITEPGELEATHRLAAAWDVYRRADDDAQAARDPVAAYLGPLEQARAVVEAATDEILSLNADAMQRKSEDAKRMARRLLALMTAATVGALAVGLLVSSSLTTRTVRPLFALARAVRRFGEGHGDARVRARGDDEISALGREFDTMAERLEQYRKSSLGDLMRARQSAQAAIESLHHPVLILDAEGVVLNLNRVAESLLGVGRDDGNGRPLQALTIDPALRDRLDAARAHVVSGRGPYLPHRLDEAISISRADGPRRFLPQAAALYSDEGSAIGVTIVLQDVTRLARFDELRNDLVATVAHEFRTPLTSLQLAIHMCADGAAGPLTGEQATLMTGARKDCARLLDIVDEILDLSRIQAGTLEIHARPIETDRLLEHAASAAEAAAHAAGIDLDIHRAGQLAVIADPERIDIVLANMVGNALRHSPPGGHVVARARRKGRVVRFEVQDSGPGIPPQYVDRIFERFFQVPGGKRGGVGLGLYIAREIVHAHGGAIGVDAAPAGGTTFWFTVPIAPPT
jgi:NtrC-family two-component system sensor histidine kinase KinB